MQDRPTSVELLEAAADFVESELVPAIQGARQFQARVVANVMRIVAREIKMEDPLVRSEVKALAHCSDAKNRICTASTICTRPQPAWAKS